MIIVVIICCDSMTEMEDKINQCNEELHQIAALNSVVNIPETTDSKTAKLQTYEAKMITLVFNDTYSELASYIFYKTNKKRAEKIPIEIILNTLVPVQTKTARTVTKLKKEIECWEREFMCSNPN